MIELAKFNCGVELAEELTAAFREEFQFISRLTAVQKKCIPAFLKRKDLIVQSPTGSGKTLAFAVPLVQLLSCKESWNKWQCGALVLVPNRELAVQITSVFRKLLKHCSGLSVVCWTGGNKVEQDILEYKKSGGNIIIATPGRLQALLEAARDDFRLSGHFRSLEVLILDEVDRLLENEFEISLATILSSVPKQRRTGLFSATQVSEKADICRLSLRNPVKIVIAAEKCSDSILEKKSVKSAGSVIPLQLNNYYKVVEAEKKFAYLICFLQQHSDEKVLLFFSTCACVDYFSKFLIKYLPKDLNVLVLHGKKKKKRQRIFERFYQMQRGLMICTDILARGIDVPGISWVVQFDPPKKANWFIHRSGRTARCSNEGNALALLMPNESGYVEFLRRNQSIDLEELQDVEEPEPGLAERIRLSMVEAAAGDREVLEKGSRAFVSYMQSYSKHDCHWVCSLKELDVAGVGNSFGLLRLPRMPELRGKDLSSFRRSDIDTSKIKYRNKGKERARQQQTKAKADPADSQNDGQRKLLKTEKKRKITLDDWDEFAEDAKLLKKLKKGKITKDKFNEMFCPGLIK